jgi:hypothetical protein
MKVKKRFTQNFTCCKERKSANFLSTKKTDKMKVCTQKSNKKCHRAAVHRIGQGFDDKYCNDANEVSALKKPLNIWVFSKYVTADHTILPADFTYCDLYYIHPYYSDHI